MREKDLVIVLNNEKVLNRNEEKTKPNKAETFTDPKNIAQRDEYIKRIDVLSKVKGLLLLGGMEFATTKQIAEYYEVGVEAIKSIAKRHRSELETDGMVKQTYSDIKKVTVHEEPLLSSGVSYRGANLFSRRAILRVGMLLKHSGVAEEVRTQLLNVEETATIEHKTTAVDREGELMLAVMRAVDQVEQLKAIAELNKFKDARIEEARAAAAKYKEKSNKFDYVIDQTGLLTLTNVGKSYLDGVSAFEINRFLIDQGILYKNKIDGVRMYKKGYEKYFKVVTYDAGYRTLKVTLEGALYIADLYKRNEGEENAV